MFISQMFFSAPGDGFPTNGLLAYWKFDENTGTVASDASGNGHTGTLTDAGLWTASGQINSALQNDETNYVNLGTATNILSIPTGGFSFAVWIFLGATSDNVRIFDLNWQTSGSIASDNKGVLFEIIGGEVFYTLQQSLVSGFGTSGFRGVWDTDLALQTGWNLVVVDRTTTDANAYVRNTTELISANLSGTFGNLDNFGNRANRILAGGGGTNDATVDRMSTSGTRVDELGVWDRVLTSDERDVLWNGGSGLQP